MLKPPHTRPAIWLLSGTLALFGVSCSNNDSATAPSPSAVAVSTAPSPAASTPPKQAPAKAKKLQKKAVKPKPVTPAYTGPDPYEQAVDTAISAKTISESAASREDWQLVASRWQEAVSLIKAVPPSSPHQAKAKRQLSEYQRQLSLAKVRSTPPKPKAKPKTATPVIANAKFFQVPIKRRQGGIPIIEVTFNSKQKFDMLLDTGASGTLITRWMAHKLAIRPVGMGKATIADGSVTEFYIGFVKSIQIGGGAIRDVPVGIAPPQMEIGLLGQDFIGKYDMTIKRDVIEFRRRN